MDRRESSESHTEEEEEEEEEFVTEGVKVVEWPPHKDMEEDAMTSTVTTSVRYVTVTNNSCGDVHDDNNQSEHQQHKTFLSKELFSPGKLDVGSRWKPPSGSGDSGDLSGAPKRKLKNLNEVLQNEAVIGKHVTYHVPPGTTRTHRAQESYEKHLNWTVKEVK